MAKNVILMVCTNYKVTVFPKVNGFTSRIPSEEDLLYWIISRQKKMVAKLLKVVVGEIGLAITGSNIKVR